MSEELIQKDMQGNGEIIGDLEYYSIGATTLGQLKSYNIIPKRDYGANSNKKPDAILVDRRDLNNIQVKLVAEYKKPEELSTEAKRKKAIAQCLNRYCLPLKSPIGVITDGTQHIWINPAAGDDNRIILREDGYPLGAKIKYSGDDEKQEFVKLVNRVIGDISSVNSKLQSEEYRDPSALASKVWQKIWLASGENPDACLATFVEIFVFKYLSDLGVLTKNSSAVPVSFDDVMKIDENEILKYYTLNIRDAIKKLFPFSKKDGTSVINGSVLNHELEEHNILFKDILREFHKFGSLKNIDPEFKSRLYEKFLKNSISQKNWGQFFTPRNIVKAMVEVSGIENLPDGSLVHDPACGVGGFLLEPLLNKREGDFSVSGKKISSKLKYSGYDRDKKTIILAKANMLIHVNELIGSNPTMTTQFSSLFNSTFSQIKDSNLGSLSLMEKDKYDLILTNPPFVVRGTADIKKTISKNAKLSSFFAVRAQGIEGLFLESIIRSTKKGGTIVTIVPDGIMNRSSDSKIRQFIMEQCFIEAIISLPENSFYTTPKKTYIMILRKKTDFKIDQSEAVFTYLVKDVGETLDVKRFPAENDLIEMVRLYKYFRSDKSAFVSSSDKCKVFGIEIFSPKEHWSIDRWWSIKEKQRIGVLSTQNETSVGNFIIDTKKSINRMKEIIKNLESQPVVPPVIKNSVEICLGDQKYFKLQLGSRVLKEDIYDNIGGVPLYSANVKEPFGYIDNVEDLEREEFSRESILWSIDSDFDSSVIESNIKFRHTDHCGRITVNVVDIDPYFISYSLLKLRETFDRGFRSSILNMSKISITVPVRLDRFGKPLVKHVKSKDTDRYEKYYVFDLKTQKATADYYTEFNDKKMQLKEEFNSILEKHLPYL
ncbi:N-6 DNA methylase [Deinococcus aquaticus]|uniref:site-specific DNA-methyltransferase (adenine-specific) n=1 Tax=Deinococcus aquaticus TaxID=328692 RepID=A0ABY7V2W4_9DEIO|nr:N-6 DNA methylase [Deinococcus aquaticus]WDA59517.1 N-6 DNA methylase [Deinococcus aquaticus]